MANTLGAKPVVDTSEFKAQLKSMNDDLRVMESGFRANTASMGDWAKTGTGLETRIKSLNSQMDVQRQKVTLLKTEYERIKSTKGEDAAATKNAEVAYNKSVETLGKMENELGQTDAALNEMKSGTDEAGKSVKDMGDKSTTTKNHMEGLKNVMNGVAAVAKAVVAAIIAVAAAAVAAVGAVAGLVYKASEAADAISMLSGQTGISTDKLQEMAYAGSQLDVSLETMTGSQTKLIRSMASAQDQYQAYAEAQAKAAKDGKTFTGDLGEQAKAFEQLGVQVLDSNGNLRDSQVVWAEAIDALGKIENPAERDALAMQLMGKSAQDLNPLIAAGSDELARLSEEAHKNGAVVSAETIQNLDKLSDSMAGLKLSAQGVGMTLAGVFAPFFQGVVDQAQGVMNQLSEIVGGSGGDITKMLNGYWVVTPEGESEFHSGIIQLITGILTDIAAAAPQLLTAGLTIVTTILNAILAALPTLIPMGVQVILTLLNAILPMLPQLIEAGVQAITMLIDGLAKAAPELVPVIILAMGAILKVIWDNMPAFLEAGAQLLIAICQGLVNAVPTETKIAIEQFLTELAFGVMAGAQGLVKLGSYLLDKIVSGVKAGAQGLVKLGSYLLDKIVTGVKTGVLGLLKLGSDLVKQLVSGITSVLSSMQNAGMELVNALITSIGGMVGALMDIGRQIVEGIWSGIQAAKDWFTKMIEDFFNGLINSILNALGIQSPSTVFAEIGKQSMRGFAVGFEQEFKAVEKKIARAMGGLGGLELNPAFAGAGAGGLGGTTNQSSIGPFYAPVIIQGTQTAGSLGAAIKGKRF